MGSGDGVKMSFAEVRSYAQKFQSESEKLDESITRMYNYVNQLRAGWNGEAATGFENKLNSLKSGFNQTKTVIAEISSNLNTSANEMEELDSKLGSGWNK